MRSGFDRCSSSVAVIHFLSDDTAREPKQYSQIPVNGYVIRKFEKPGLKPWLATDHMLVVVRQGPDWDDVYIVHNTKPRARKEQLVSFLSIFTFVEGVKVIRIRGDAETAVTSELERMADVPVPSPEEVE